MKSTSIRFLRELLDLHIEVEKIRDESPLIEDDDPRLKSKKARDEYNKTFANLWKRTPWTDAISFVFERVAIQNVTEGCLRELLARVRLGEMENTPLSAELVRLDAEGFAEELCEFVRLSHPEIARTLSEVSTQAEKGDSAGNPTAPALSDDTACDPSKIHNSPPLTRSEEAALLLLFQKQSLLCTLDDFENIRHPHCQSLSRQTASKSLKKLRQAGYADRPRGEKAGARITKSGIELAEQISRKLGIN